MQTPLVIAMPEPMADALGYPEKPVGWADILRLAQRPAGLGRLRPPRVGPVPARQDQPQLLDQRPVGADRPGLRRHRQDRGPLAARTWPTRRSSEFARGVESAVVHYGDTTLTFLNNWYRADQRGHLAHLRVGRGRRGEVGHRLQPGQPRRRPRPGRATRASRRSRSSRSIPKEGTLYSRQPVLRPRRRLGQRRRAARRPRPFEDFVQAAREPGARCSSSGSGPATPTSPSATRSARTNGVDPDQPPTLLEVPGPDGHGRAARPLGRAAQERPGAARARRVRLDGRPRRARTAPRPSSTWPSRRPSTPSTQFKDDDEVGLRIFTTEPRRRHRPPSSTSSRPADRRATASGCAAEIDGPAPTQRHAAVRASPRPRFDEAIDGLRPDAHQRRGAADRRRERRRRPPTTTSSSTSCSAASRGQPRARPAKPVRIFPIAYGDDADLDVLRASPRPPTSTVTTPATRPPSTRSSPPWSATSDRRGPPASATGSGRRRSHVAVDRRPDRSCWPGAGRRRRHRGRPAPLQPAVARRRWPGRRGRRRRPTAAGWLLAVPRDTGSPLHRPLRAWTSPGAASCRTPCRPPPLRRGRARPSDRGPLRDRLVEIGERLDDGPVRDAGRWPSRASASRPPGPASTAPASPRAGRAPQRIAEASADPAPAATVEALARPARLGRAHGRGHRRHRRARCACSTPAWTRPSPAPSSCRAAARTWPTPRSSTARSTGSSARWRPCARPWRRPVPSAASPCRCPRRGATRRAAT